MIDERARQQVTPYLERALQGASHHAARVALDLLDSGVPESAVIDDLLAAAQREVGDRWQVNELSVADEHLATGVAEVALHALADTVTAPATAGFVVVACAEGDWHSIAAHMFAEQLRSRGFAVAFLGASTPADHVATFMARHRPDALAVSCNLPLFYAGVTRLTDAAHAHGVPVLAGGRSLDGGPDRALRIGADGWAADLDESVRLLTAWSQEAPRVAAAPTRLDRSAMELDAAAPHVGRSAFDDLTRRFPAMGSYDDAQIARTREDLVFIVQFIAASRLVDDIEVLTTFLTWLADLLAARGVPRRALEAGLESLHSVLLEVDGPAATLCESGLAHLSAP